MVRIFKEFPKEDICPICGTNANKECILIAIEGTQEGNIAEAQCFHFECLQLFYNKDTGIIYQVLKK